MSVAVSKSRARLSLLVGDGLAHGASVHRACELGSALCSKTRPPAIGVVAPAAARAAKSACLTADERVADRGRRLDRPKAGRRDAHAARSGVAAV